MDSAGRRAAVTGAVAAAGYGWLKAAWGAGSTVGIRDVGAWHERLDGLAAWQRFVALEGTALLDVAAVALLVLLVQGLAPRWLRVIAQAGGALVAAVGLVGLASVAGPALGRWHDGPSPLATWVFVLVYGCFVVLGRTTARTACRADMAQPRTGSASPASSGARSPVSPAAAARRPRVKT